MKFFGSIIFLICVEIFSSPKSNLSKSEILKGEPLNLEIELREEGEIEFKQNSFSGNGVVAEFVGQEENISNINGKVTRKKIYRFRILTNKIGNLETPKINFELDGKYESISSIPFFVKNEKYKPKQITGNSIFDRLFNESDFERFKENYEILPTQDDFQIHFTPTKNSIFVGESIIGFYKIYFRNLPEAPSVQRNMLKGNEFPFFTFELLGNMELKISSSEFIDGQEFYTIPYNQEIYMLTPLRRGKFQLGESDFIIQGGTGVYFQPLEKKSRKKTITVKELPTSPKDFSGQVGEYKASFHFTKNSSKQNEPISFELKISGYGGLGNWSDPLKNYCSENKCDGKIVYISDSKTKQVSKLDYGGYGYQTDSIFKYSYIPEKVGKIELGELRLNFFNPSNESYKTISVSFPEFNIEQGNIFSFEKIPSEFILFWKTWTIYLIGICFFIYGIYLAKDELQNRFKKYLEKFQIFQSQTPDEILKFDLLIGNKKGTLLRVFLANKGLKKSRIEEIIQLKSKSETLEFQYKNSKLDEKKYLTELFKNVFQEIKE